MTERISHVHGLNCKLFPYILFLILKYFVENIYHFPFYLPKLGQVAYARTPFFSLKNLDFHRLRVFVAKLSTYLKLLEG